MLQLAGLWAGYGDAPAIRDVDLEVGRGEVVALLGANGAGKSTTLGATAGLVKVFRGSVSFDGEDITGRAVHDIARRGLSLVPEDRSLLPSLTVAENLRIVHDKVEDPLVWFPALERLLKRRAGLLSGGEQQMLALARAIASGPRMLMVDELSLGLAPKVVKDLLVRLTEFAHEKDAAVLIVEQHIAQALAAADRAYVLTGGRISDSGDATAMLARRNLIESSYLGQGDRPVAPRGA